MTDTVREAEAAATSRTREFSELLRHHHRELGTTEPRDLDAIEMVTDLTRLEARLTKDFEKHVHRPLGLTWAGFRILNALWVYGPVGQQDIGRVSGSTRASISSALATLESRGLVTRERDETDRRQLNVQLTDEGTETLRKAIAAQTRRERAWTAVLRDDQLSELVHLLRTLVNQDTPAAD
ncbi:MarR family winged helix-turn-helix transcriptional regulator [Streptomyces caniscabiei]|nr:MarR family transcriptional regulator [Streptomyces caniscabiei]MDX3510942.1 MarR family transcriptional regulator [Streptomyces caniscabiei]MDX3720114.1 MarR family transcriptional regulator [Streptomyces caniscabiei]MDX3729298.1 MarR family transcriptional regulator [Streptomyces caniscabiei]WEO29226.1 MarR family transcriptional regulator [Streptomyces caniscabiei]